MPERLVPLLWAGRSAPVYAYAYDNPLQNGDPTGEEGAALTVGGSVGLGAVMGFEFEAGAGLYYTYDEASGDLSVGTVGTGAMAAGPLPSPTEPSTNLETSTCSQPSPTTASAYGGMEKTLTVGGFAGVGGPLTVSTASNPAQLEAKSTNVVVATPLALSAEVSVPLQSATFSLGKSTGAGIAVVQGGATAHEVAKISVPAVKAAVSRAWTSVTSIVHNR